MPHKDVHGQVQGVRAHIAEKYGGILRKRFCGAGEPLFDEVGGNVLKFPAVGAQRLLDVADSFLVVVVGKDVEALGFHGVNVPALTDE